MLVRARRQFWVFTRATIRQVVTYNLYGEQLFGEGRQLQGRLSMIFARTDSGAGCALRPVSVHLSSIAQLCAGQGRVVFANTQGPLVFEHLTF